MSAIGWIAFCVLALGYLVFVIWAIVLDANILTEANSRLPTDEQFPLILNSTRSSELRRRYEALFPDGKLHRRSIWLPLAALVCAVRAVAALLHSTDRTSHFGHQAHSLCIRLSSGYPFYWNGNTLRSKSPA
jgi:hypothetical protein